MRLSTQIPSITTKRQHEEYLVNFRVQNNKNHSIQPLWRNSTNGDGRMKLMAMNEWMDDDRFLIESVIIIIVIIDLQ